LTIILLQKVVLAEVVVRRATKTDIGLELERACHVVLLLAHDHVGRGLPAYGVVTVFTDLALRRVKVVNAVRVGLVLRARAQKAVILDALLDEPALAERAVGVVKVTLAAFDRRELHVERLGANAAA